MPLRSAPAAQRGRQGSSSLFSGGVPQLARAARTPVIPAAIAAAACHFASVRARSVKLEPSGHV